MGLWQVVVVLARRWYVTLAAFLATAGLVVVARDTLPVQYSSGSVMVVTASLTGQSDDGGTSRPELTNPLLSFDRGVNLTTSILIQELNSAATMKALNAPAGGTTTYVVSDGNTNAELLQSGPFLFVQASAPTPEEAENIVTAVDRTAARILARRQKDLHAPTSTYLTLDEIVPPAAGRELTNSPSRAALAAGALSTMISVAAALGFERLLVRRRGTARRTQVRERGDARP